MVGPWMLRSEDAAEWTISWLGQGGSGQRKSDDNKGALPVCEELLTNKPGQRRPTRTQGCRGGCSALVQGRGTAPTLEGSQKQRARGSGLHLLVH